MRTGQTVLRSSRLTVPIRATKDERRCDRMDPVRLPCLFFVMQGHLDLLDADGANSIMETKRTCCIECYCCRQYVDM